MTESVSPSLDQIVEGALLASSEPLPLDRLLALFDEHEEPSRGELRAALTVLEQRLEGSAMTLIESASGFRLAIDTGLSPWVSRLWEERPQRYSRALLETLALIAYRQPVTRGDIEDIRGVSISATIMRTLHERGWIRVVGHRDAPGRPAVYATTRSFLDDLGLRTLDELPPMAELAERFADAPAHDDSDDADARAAMEATNALLQAVPDEEEDDEDADDAKTASESIEMSRLSFGNINERLSERMKERTKGADANTEALEASDDESGSMESIEENMPEENLTENVSNAPADASADNQSTDEHNADNDSLQDKSEGKDTQ